MTARRPWPRPPDGAIHLIGDTHFGSPAMTTNRKNLWAADLGSRMLPESVCHVIVGDLVDTGAGAEDTEAIGYLDTQFGIGQWVSAVGNHDVFTGRTTAQAAAAWGMPGPSFVRDLGFARLIVISPDDGIENDSVSMVPFSSDRLNWLDRQLLDAGTTPCLMVCHWSLYDTVKATTGSATSATSTGFFAENDSDIRAVLADNANAAAWLSGHIHCPVSAPDLVMNVTTGAASIAAINASAINYTGDNTNNLSSELTSMYVTVTNGRIDVYFRDHGAGVWRSAGPNRLTRWSVAT